MEKLQPLPSLCRNVIYVQHNGTQRAAIVVHVDPEKLGAVTLAVFVPVDLGEREATRRCSGVDWAHDVPWDGSADPAPQTWHYPPRVG